MSNPGSIEIISEQRCFNGRQLRVQHPSQCNKCNMTFSLYLPPQAEHHKVPLLYWLSGLTCDDQNFTTKAGAQRYAAEHGIAIVAPDTSPRGDQVADDSAWDFGQGAGFYVDASQAPWQDHFQMYSYISQELPALLSHHFPLDITRQSIFGHSMGGHGAMVIALNNSQTYQSVSAFSPICAPSQCAWGIKALTGYLGSDTAQWQRYDSCQLITKAARPLPLLVDQGDADEFLEQQLKTPLLEQACETADYPLQLRIHSGYDHSYYFIASFMADHLRFHARYLCPEPDWQL